MLCVPRGRFAQKWFKSASFLHPTEVTRECHLIRYWRAPPSYGLLKNWGDRGLQSIVIVPAPLTVCVLEGGLLVTPGPMGHERRGEVRWGGASAGMGMCPASLSAPRSHFPEALSLEVPWAEAFWPCRALSSLYAQSHQGAQDSGEPV